MSVIQRAWEEVYSSLASSALARASTVERNVRSRLSKLDAFATASLTWCATPARRRMLRSSKGVPSGSVRTTMQPSRPPSSRSGATAIRPLASSAARRPGSRPSRARRAHPPRAPCARARRRRACPGGRPRRASRSRRSRGRRGRHRRASWSQTDERGFSRSRADSSTARSSTSSSDSASASWRLKSRSALRDLERGLGALGLESLGLVQACVLERDRGVAAQHLEQADVVLVELVDAELRDDDGADHAGAVAERDGDHRLVDVVACPGSSRR